jgi:hypothetical protein
MGVEVSSRWRRGEFEMGLEVSTNSATEAAGGSIAELQLGVAVAPASDVDRVVEEPAREGLPA